MDIQKDYKNFLEKNNFILIDDGKNPQKQKLGKKFEPHKFAPVDFKLQVTNVWCFREPQKLFKRIYDQQLIFQDQVRQTIP